jgi:hypothetical protein
METVCRQNMKLISALKKSSFVGENNSNLVGAELQRQLNFVNTNTVSKGKIVGVSRLWPRTTDRPIRCRATRSPGRRYSWLAISAYPTTDPSTRSRYVLLYFLHLPASAQKTKSVLQKTSSDDISAHTVYAKYHPKSENDRDKREMHRWTLSPISGISGIRRSLISDWREQSLTLYWTSE